MPVVCHCYSGEGHSISTRGYPKLLEKSSIKPIVLERDLQASVTRREWGFTNPNHIHTHIYTYYIYKCIYIYDIYIYVYLNISVYSILFPYIWICLSHLRIPAAMVDFRGKCCFFLIERFFPIFDGAEGKRQSSWTMFLCLGQWSWRVNQLAHPLGHLWTSSFRTSMGYVSSLGNFGSAPQEKRKHFPSISVQGLPSAYLVKMYL